MGSAHAIFAIVRISFVLPAATVEEQPRPKAADRGETVGQTTDHFDAQHWRRLADDARVSAARIDDPDGKRRMLEMAAAYDQFAEEAEQRSAAPR